jgi:glycosyltransferase involved in cell wall biosynthesis
VHSTGKNKGPKYWCRHESLPLGDSKNIFPLTDGARIVNFSLIKSMRPFIQELDMLIFDESNSNSAEEIDLYKQHFIPDQLFFLKSSRFNDTLAKFFHFGYNFLKNPTAPVSTGYFNTKKIKSIVKEIVSERNYDYIIFDGLHPFSAFEELDELKNIRLIYRAHNVEHDLWFTKARTASNFLFSFLLRWQGQLMKNHEMNLVRSAYKVWTITEDDLKSFEKISKKRNLEIIPVGLHFEKIDFQKCVDEEKPIQLLFLGRLDWSPNKDGLKWFLREVWPYIDHKKFELNIVGSGDSSWGELLFNSPGIKFLGLVNDVNDVYSKCDISIIPIRFGSGLRIKVVESISKGIPVISTRMGIQGSGLNQNEYFHAENGRDWIETLGRIDRESAKDKAQRAFVRLREIYSSEAIAKRAFSSLQCKNAD